jgi:hypothetical protein
MHHEIVAHCVPMRDACGSTSINKQSGNLKIVTHNALCDRESCCCPKAMWHELVVHKVSVSNGHRYLAVLAVLSLMH